MNKEEYIKECSIAVIAGIMSNSNLDRNFLFKQGIKDSFLIAESMYQEHIKIFPKLEPFKPIGNRDKELKGIKKANIIITNTANYSEKVEYSYINEYEIMLENKEKDEVFILPYTSFIRMYPLIKIVEILEYIQINKE